MYVVQACTSMLPFLKHRHRWVLYCAAKSDVSFSDNDPLRRCRYLCFGAFSILIDHPSLGTLAHQILSVQSVLPSRALFDADECPRGSYLLPW